MSPWSYPRWIAHRGAGRLAPENTLAAFRLGAAHGYRMFECDARLSADGVPFLLHDDTLERTTNGQGLAGAQPWAALSRLDAGGWHSAAHAGEPLPTLEAVGLWCLAEGRHLNIELKPTPGTERATGRAVAAASARLWARASSPPLLTSFQAEALEGAREAAPQLPRGLLVKELWEGWLARTLTLDCVAVVAHHPLWTQALVDEVHGHGLRCLTYTVNDEAIAGRLLGWGLDGLITDRVDRFTPD